MGLSSWQVLRVWAGHWQPQKNNFLYFLIELIEIYLPVPKVCFSKKRNEAPSPKYCSCKIPLYQDFLGIFEHLDFWTFYHCILYSFLRGFSLWQRGIDSTKQMMVYDQITFFNKCFDLLIFFSIFLRCKKHEKKPEKTWKSLRILANGGFEIIIWC